MNTQDPDASAEAAPKSPDKSARHKNKFSPIAIIARNAPGLTRVFLGSAAAMFAGAYFTDTTQANKIKFVLTSPEGIIPAQSQGGHYIFSGDGYSAYGMISNRLTAQMERKLGPEGEGYGGYLGTGGSYLNLQQVAQDGNELAIALVQSDVLEQQLASDEKIKTNIRPLLKTNILEAVLMPTTRPELQTIGDITKASNDAALGLRPKIKIAALSSHRSGSYYTATIISKNFNPEGVEIIDYGKTERAIGAAKSGAADLAVIVEYPAEVKKQVSSAVSAIKTSGMHLIQADAVSYIFSLNKNYSLIRVDMPGYQTPQTLLAMQVVIVGRAPESITTSGTRELSADFQQNFKTAIQAKDICFEQKLPGLQIIQPQLGTRLETGLACEAEETTLKKITAQFQKLHLPKTDISFIWKNPAPAPRSANTGPSANP